ncbi:RluA family pseudouridine synthase [Paenibacillus pasadenensis]|uniref:RluA family pseudouridine synthase n=1 Tax=Paenibacillus pasadenensis TaxID=217090 RepID=UPI00203C4919|nr:RluA family pseudouridine synthase [Paenibacillus pasadenensis]MCM3746276.1 RluA family pseudouridine synthase [Paenibacillus pasadenensis]
MTIHDKKVDHAIETEQSENDNTLEWAIDSVEAGQRLDKFITDKLADPSISRTQVQEWIVSGAATVSGRTVKANYKLSAGDKLTVAVPEPEAAEIVPEPIPLDIVYEDSDVIVINKPRGMVVHPAPGHSSGTVVNALMHHCKDLSGINGVLRPGIVHRIDKDTSGLLMAAKNDLAHLSLAEQLKEHSVTRKYIALVHDNLHHDIGTIDAPIGRDDKDRKMFTVTTKGSKHAVTHFQVIERIGDYTLVELQLETGRTHQIRVHLKYIGHPLAGDPVYGRNKTVALNGQALHAALLGFTHPRTGERLEFEAPIPEDMQHVLTSLRNR